MTMRHLKRVRRLGSALAEAVYLMLCCMPATGLIESHFSYLQAIGGNRRAKTSLENLRAEMKIMVDGPPIDDFVLCKNLSGGAAMYVASHLCLQAQHYYYSLYGGRDCTQSDAKANMAGLQTMIPRTHKGLPQKTQAGSKRHAVQQQLVELKSALVGTAGSVASDPQGHEFRQLALAAQAERWSAQQEKRLEGHESIRVRKRDAVLADLMPAGAHPGRKQKLTEMEAKAAAVKLVQVGQLLSTVHNARESRFLDVHGCQVLLWLPDTGDVARDVWLKLGFLPATIYIGMRGLANIVRCSGQSKVWFIKGPFPTALRLSLEHIKENEAQDSPCLPTCES